MLQQAASAMGERNGARSVHGLAAERRSAEKDEPHCAACCDSVEDRFFGSCAGDLAAARCAAGHPGGCQPQSAAAVADGIACGGVRGVERQRCRSAQTSAGVQQDGDAVGDQNDGVSVRCVAA